MLQADGGTRCACINAAFLALADAGIPMRDMVAGCAVGYLQSTALLDLNYMEDSGGGPDISVAVHPNLDRLVLLQVSKPRCLLIYHDRHSGRRCSGSLVSQTIQHAYNQRSLEQCVFTVRELSGRCSCGLAAEALAFAGVYAVQMDGKLPPETFEECVALAVDGCKAVSSVMRQELLRHTKKQALAQGMTGALTAQ